MRSKRERERGRETERTKTWNKSPHFCSLESFSNYGRSGEQEDGDRGEARGEEMAEKENGGGARTSCDLYLAKVSELLNFPAPKKETR